MPRNVIKRVMRRRAMGAAGRLLAVAVAAGIVLGVLGGVAQASPGAPSLPNWTWSNIGTPGGVQLLPTQANVLLTYDTSITFPARTAYRSTAYPTSTQTIKATYTIWKWNGSTGRYELYNAASGSYLVAPSHSVTIGSWTWSVLFANFYTVTIDVSWYVGTTFVGSQHIAANSSADFKCMVPDPTLCEVGQGYVWLY
jgi:hypothetical protein